MTARGVGGLEVFAVEDRSLQISWSSIAPGDLLVRAGDHEQVVEHRGGPGAVEIADLEPDRSYIVEVRGAALGEPVRLSATTLRSLGRERYRLATVSDLHVGIDHFGVLRTMRDASHFPHDDGHAVECTRAALHELEAWGAQRVIVKGDVTEHGHAPEWATVSGMIADSDVPALLLPGNHDVNFRAGALDPVAGAAAVGLHLVRESTAIDVDGARIVLLDSSGAALHRGIIEQHRAEDALDLLREASTGCLLLTHHHFQRTPVPWFWPPGIRPHRGEPFLRAVAEANPRTLVSSGHTHRHRRRRLGPIEITEVGSPKDYPGTWAGYVVYDRGIRQVVRRVSAPPAIAWTERTGRALLTWWRHWSPGRLEDRCFVQEWD